MHALLLPSAHRIVVQVTIFRSFTDFLSWQNFGSPTLSSSRLAKRSSDTYWADARTSRDSISLSPTLHTFSQARKSNWRISPKKERLHEDKRINLQKNIISRLSDRWHSRNQSAGSLWTTYSEGRLSNSGKITVSVYMLSLTNRGKNRQNYLDMIPKISPRRPFGGQNSHEPLIFRGLSLSLWLDL